MDFLSYRAMPMRIIRTVHCERIHELDGSGTTYKWTRWRGAVICTYSPGAISFNPSGTPPWGSLAPNTGNGGQPTLNGGPNAAGAPGNLPAITDAAIREYLSQPRGQLIIQSLGNLVLVSPRTFGQGAVLCDANNGPFIKVGNIVEIAGERMWQVELQFETCIIENPTPTLIVSNRWVAEAGVNWQHLTTRTYYGTVTVRSDGLYDLRAGVPLVQPAPGTQPLVVAPGQLDAIRQSFCGFSVPNNFQRQVVDVRVSEDGLTANYVVVDTEQLWNKGANCPAVRLEVQESSYFWEARTARFVLAGFNAGNLPKYHFRVHVRAWGNGQRPRTNLLHLALGIAISRVGANGIMDPTLDEIVTSADLNNSVDVVFTRAWDMASLGIVGGAIEVVRSLWFNGAAEPNNGQLQLLRLQEQSPDIAANGFMPDPVQQQLSGARANPAFPGAGGTRGTWLGNLVAQVLESFHGAPGAPP